CVGGGSSYAGLAYPFIADRLAGRTQTRFIATEPAACPTLTKGRFAYDLADAAGMTPLLPMYTLGHTFVPAPVHAGGLRYHGDSPSLSLLVRHGHMEARAYSQNEVFDAAVRFAHAEGIIPAPESAHGLKAVIEEADAAREADEERVILVNLSGHGYFDMQAYDDYINGRLPDFEFDPAAEDAALADLVRLAARGASTRSAHAARPRGRLPACSGRRPGGGAPHPPAPAPPAGGGGGAGGVSAGARRRAWPRSSPGGGRAVLDRFCS